MFELVEFKPSALLLVDDAPPFPLTLFPGILVEIEPTALLPYVSEFFPLCNSYKMILL